MLLGRQTELSTLNALVDEGRSLTIHGGPGMGKASLARQLSRRSRLRFVEVNLAADEAPPPQAPALLLIGLDRGDEDLDWLQRERRPYIATSRWTSRCASVHQHRIGRLDAESATALFAMHSEGRLISEDVRALCDGIPDLIVQAAERGAITPLPLLRAEFERGMWDWPRMSEELDRLDLRTQTIFAGLAAFVPVDRCTAQTILGSKGFEAALAVLQDRNLLRTQDNLLIISPPVAALLRRRRRATQRPGVRLVEEGMRRRVRHYRQTRPDDLAWLRRHRDDLIEVAQAPRTRPDVAAKAYLAIEPLLTMNGSMFGNLSLLGQAEALALESDNPSLIAATSWASGKAWLMRSCQQRCLESLHQIDALAPRIDDVSVAVHSYVAIAHAKSALQKTEEAKAYAHEAASWAQAEGLPYEAALARIQYAFISHEAGLYGDALRLADESSRAAALDGLRRIKALADLAAGLTLAAQGDAVAAHCRLLGAAGAFAELGETTHAAFGRVEAARAAATQGALDAAFMLCRTTIADARGEGDEESELSALMTWAEIELDADRFEAARDRIAVARPLAMRVGVPPLLDRLHSAEQRVVQTGRLLQREGFVQIDGRARYVYIDGRRIDLARRAAVRRILRHLVEATNRTPGEVVDVDTLFRIGWPGTKAPPNARNKVYTALWTLRRLGLQDVLITHAQGYALDPERLRVI